MTKETRKILIEAAENEYKEYCFKMKQLGLIEIPFGTWKVLWAVNNFKPILK